MRLQEYRAYYDVDKEGKDKELCRVGGEILDFSDGAWLMPGARTKCYLENKAACMLWDPVPEANCPACKSIELFKENNWNKVDLQSHSKLIQMGASGLC